MRSLAVQQLKDAAALQQLAWLHKRVYSSGSLAGQQGRAAADVYLGCALAALMQEQQCV
jgi:hypothetical protein